jgi:hypothetical protein
MLLLASGLVVWKLNSKEKEPEVITEKASEETPKEEAVVFDNAPPPPPEEEEVEEEKPEEKKVVTKPSGPSGCSGDCAGKMTPSLSSALASRGAMARNCYNTALRNNPNLEGKMMMSVRLSPSGSICSAHVSSNSLGDQAVASCVSAKFRAGNFPPPDGGCINANVPLNFTAKQ